MSTTRFLDYEIALLLAQYGKEALMASLGRKLGASQSDLETLLDQIGQEKPKGRLKPKQPDQDPVDLVIAAHRFQNRSFLPELRDVKRFFEQHGRNLGRPKSRNQCLLKLLQLFVELNDTEVASLLESPEHAKYSSLGVISDEILRREK